jgi:hypothetical protein
MSVRVAACKTKWIFKLKNDKSLAWRGVGVFNLAIPKPIFTFRSKKL